MIYCYYERVGSGFYFIMDKELGNLYEVIVDIVRLIGLFEYEKVIGIVCNYE